MKPTAMLLLALALSAPSFAQEPPVDEQAISSWLSSLLKIEEKSGDELAREVARIGGVPFLSEVPIEFMRRGDIKDYMAEVLADEYPIHEAEADKRLLTAFDLLAESADLRETRARLLAENVVGFYDERPGKKRLFAVSSESRMTALNQMILVHELRHALQDQYIDVHRAMPRSIGDFDDRRLAFWCLLEGDATWLMERYMTRGLSNTSAAALDSLWMASAAMNDDVPPILQDQLVLPYVVGRVFARTLWNKGGWAALRQAWTAPPRTTEQVLHPEKYEINEESLPVDPPRGPAHGRLLRDGVLGEILIRSWLGQGSDAAAAGWGGDRYRVWDVGGRTLLLWRCRFDSRGDLDEFESALVARMTRRFGRLSRIGRLSLFERGQWQAMIKKEEASVLYGASDDAGVLLRHMRE